MAQSSERRLRARARRFVRGTRLKYEGVERLLRDATACPYCARQISALVGRKSQKALELDHKLPKGRGGTNSLKNLHAVCKRDNRAKGSMTDLEFRFLLDKLDEIPDLRERVIRRLAASKAFF